MVTVAISIPLFACQDASLHRRNLENEQGYPYEYMGMVNTARIESDVRPVHHSPGSQP